MSVSVVFRPMSVSMDVGRVSKLFKDVVIESVDNLGEVENIA